MKTEVKEKPVLLSVKLTDIVPSKTNPRDDNDPGFNKESLQELAKSITEQGLIQPIVLRKNGSPGKYELVCGERRLRASRLTDLKEIPATIRELTDEQAFDLQITENLQRKDVHPLDEAIAFKTIIDKKKCSTKDVAARFGKDERFVVKRLKLNDLLPKLKKDFYAGKMYLGHAELLCRLTPESQEEMADTVNGYSGSIQPVEDLKDEIERNVMNNLSSVGFKKDDATLLPKAGACLTCPKRSGSNPLLFPEIKQGDRCFDPECFKKKSEAHILKEAMDIIANEPEVLLVRANHYTSEASPKEIKELADKAGVKVYDQGQFNECEKKKAGSKKAFVLAGRDGGKYIYIYLVAGKKNHQSGGEGKQVNETELQIANIKQRQERFDELDNEKVYHRIVDAYEQKLDKKEALKYKINKIEEAAMWYMIAELSGEDSKYDEGDLKKTCKRLLGLTPQEKSFLIRSAFLEKTSGGNHGETDEEFITAMSEEIGVPISVFRKEQSDIRDKRKARAQERIAALKEEAKEQTKK